MPLDENLTAEDLAILQDDGPGGPAMPVEKAEPEAVAVEPEAAPVEEAVETPDAPETARTVPLAVLKEERERRQEAEKRIEREIAERAKLAERLDIINQRLQPQAAPPKSIEEDPIGRLQQVDQRVAAFEAQERDRRAVEYLTQVATSHEQTFTQTAPDYYDAITHLAASRDREYQSMGVTNPVERQNLIRRDALAMTQSALQQGKSVADMAYAIAKDRGYRKAEAAPVATETTAVDSAARAATLEKGARAARSLSSTGGSPARAGLSLDSLVGMTDAEFQAATSDPDKFRRMFGE